MTNTNEESLLRLGIASDNTFDDSNNEGRCRGYCSKTNFPISLFFSMGIVSLILAAITVPTFELLITSQIQSTIIVDSPSSLSFDTWVSNEGDGGLEIFYDVFMFDVVNSVEVLEGSKPVLSQVGPLRYKEYFTRHEVDFSDDKETVSFYQQWKYVFDADYSAPLDDSDFITQMDLVVHGVKAMVDGVSDGIGRVVVDGLDDAVDSLVDTWANLTRIEAAALKGRLKNELHSDFDDKRDDDDWWRGLLLKTAICYTGGEASIKSGPFQRRSARDLYFGYRDDDVLVGIKDLLKSLNVSAADSFSTYAPGLVVNYTSKEDVIRRDNLMTVYTGHDDVTKLGKFKYYGNMTKIYVCIDYTNVCDDVPIPVVDLEGGEIPACYKFQYTWTEEEAACHGYFPMFGSDDANAIDGTDASMSGEIPIEGDYMKVFIDDLYRSVKLKFTEEVDDFHDLTLRRYVIDPKDLLSAESDASQADYYQFAYDGMENMTSASGFPLFASKPHFLDGDKRLLEGVEGLSANQDAHDTYVDFEVETGVAMRVGKRLQLNTLLSNWGMPVFHDAALKEEIKLVSGLEGLVEVMDCLAVESDWSSVNDTYLPFAWVDEHYEYGADDAEDVEDGVYGTKDMAVGARTWLFAVGGMLMVCGAWSSYYRMKVRNEFFGR